MCRDLFEQMLANVIHRGPDGTPLGPFQTEGCYPRNQGKDIRGMKWPLIPLHELCIRRPGIRNPAQNPDDKFQYVDISAVCNRTKRITNPQSLMGKHTPSRARNIIKAGDVIVATTRPNLNAVALVPDELNDQICSTGFCVFRANKQLAPKYLFAFVLSPAFIDPLADFVKGALYPAVTDSQVLAIEIPLPPLAEQERIAARLTEQLAVVESGRAAAQAQLAAIDALPAALLRDAFNGYTDLQRG